MTDTKTYKIVRHFQRTGTRRAVRWNLTLEEAQKWCKDPETSSTTCKGPKNKRRTWRNGPWFDGYTEQ